MKEQIKHTIETKFSLCGGRRCCPVVDIQNDTTFISDDYGNKIQMETEQLKLLVEKGKELF
jgi:hypothetical protein